MHPSPRLIVVADTAVAVEFGDAVDEALSARVLALDAVIRGDPPPGVLETVPTLRSLLVLYDPTATDHGRVETALRVLIADAAAEPEVEGREWTIPVAYGGEAGPDLEEVAAAAGMTAAELVDVHTGGVHRVAMLGHLPGLPYLTGPAAALPASRRAEPRMRVPAGSVAVAAGLTCIYPVAAPAGWRLVGRTAVRLFDPAADPPALLAPGDRVRLVAVDT